MPNDPRHSRFVTVNGHTGTLVIDTHLDLTETMSTASQISKELQKMRRERDKWREAAQKLAMAVEADEPTEEHTERIQQLSGEDMGMK